MDLSCRLRLGAWVPPLVAVALVCNARWQIQANRPMSETPAALLLVAAFAVWLRLTDAGAGGCFCDGWGAVGEKFPFFSQWPLTGGLKYVRYTLGIL